MSGRGVKRRRPPALVLDGYTSDTAPAALTNGTSPAASASASAVAGPSRLSTRQESRRSSAASTADVLVNTYGTRSRMTTADTGASSAGAGATSRGSSRSPAKRDAEATPTSTKRVRGRKRDLASQFAEDDANEEKIVEEVQEGEAEAEEEMDAEQSAAKTQEMEEMWERWNEEYFEIVEQLPLELHRSFALMRELEVKLQNRIKTIGKDTRAYRDARQALRAHSESTARARAVDLMPSSDGMQLDTDTPAATEPSISSSEGKGKGRAIEDLPSSSQLQQELGTMTPPPDVDSDATQPLSPKAASATPAPSAPPPTRAQRLALLQNVSRCVADGVRAAEEKVGLAVTAYDWVDRHIRRLDADLQKSESSLLLGLRAGTEASRGVREALGMTEDEVRERVEREEETSTQGGTPVAAVFDFAGNAAAAGASAAARRRKGRKSSKSQTAAARNAASAAAAEEDTQAEAEEEEAGLVPDMAIDPNEPKYCYCDQVSFGDMIACDNDDCPREWYHYNCVGLVSVPRGKWYCLFCAPPGWKGPGGDVPPNARYAPPGHKHGGSNKGRK